MSTVDLSRRSAPREEPLTVDLTALGRTLESILGRPGSPARELVEERTRRLAKALRALSGEFSDDDRTAVAALCRAGRRLLDTPYKPSPADTDERAWRYLTDLATVTDGFRELALQEEGWW
ncbi:hypothetical protein [Streptomyces tsukubensis]|uniref:Uncharacterized protein n=1 Tax=Streptomyces tsukubensis TaxID=83656 RepID=A0A1V4A4J8_9ACTN|nr:hypothetical protein [Streptomyces tsukubensis]OON75634.1 hypothetical protein B1H18_22545 [Streptomyces tsukubensis]QFR94384.1 hypothetical protein GBW32_16655 [Streptomyces tsukubensis]